MCEAAIRHKKQGNRASQQSQERLLVSLTTIGLRKMLEAMSLRSLSQQALLTLTIHLLVRLRIG